MQIEVDEKELLVLVKLIELELEEINPEIRHSATSKVKAELRDERGILKELYHRLSRAGTSAAGRVANY